MRKLLYCKLRERFGIAFRREAAAGRPLRRRGGIRGAEGRYGWLFVAPAVLIIGIVTAPSVICSNAAGAASAT